MYAKYRHELRHAKKAQPDTLGDPCLLSVPDFETVPLPLVTQAAWRISTPVSLIVSLRFGHVETYSPATEGNYASVYCTPILKTPWTHTYRKANKTVFPNLPRFLHYARKKNKLYQHAEHAGADTR
jgi:hypothetical protein